MELYHFAKVNEINKTGSKVNFILLHTLKKLVIIPLLLINGETVD